MAGNPTWTDYHVDVAAVHANFTQGGVALLGRVQDAKHFYQLELREEVGGSPRPMWYIWKYDGSIWTEIAGGAFTTQAIPYYRLRLAFHGPVISAFVAYNYTTNFQALGSGTDEAYTSGRIGLRSWSTASARFDDAYVTLDSASAPAPVPPPTKPPVPGPTKPPTPAPTKPPVPSPTKPPAPAPIPTSTNAPAQIGVASYAGCPIFTPGDYYNANVSGASVDAHSASYIASITATDNTGFYASTGIEQVNIAHSGAQLYAIHPKVSYHSFNYTQPWQSGYYIEGGGSSPSGDAHSIVLLATPPTCRLYELYNTSFVGNVLSAYSGATWDLSKPFASRNVRGSAMASGLSIFTGMVKHEEISSGIHHALNFSMFSGSPCRCYVAPATATDGLSYQGPSTAYQFPYGGHLRLKASFDDSQFGPQAKAIAEAMKHYGIYLSDTGGHYSNNNAIYLANPTDGGSWNGSDLGALGQLKFTDFEVLTVGPVTRS